MISIFDLFKIGIGPSSSHTVGPMKATHAFVEQLKQQEMLPQVTRIQIDVYGSLALTGRGHHTDQALLLGLAGYLPETVNIEQIPQLLERIQREGLLPLAEGRQTIAFHVTDLTFHNTALPQHENGMVFEAFSGDHSLLQQTWFSIGGGFIVDADHLQAAAPAGTDVAWPFASAEQLLAHCQRQGFSISYLMQQNELSFQSAVETRQRCQQLWEIMQQSIVRGCQTEGVLAGPLRVPRRAAALHRQLLTSAQLSTDPMAVIDWVNMFAMAVSEENAAGGRMVTAPTNGAAGVIPAVMAYYDKFIQPLQADDARKFLLAAGGIGLLYKMNASISGAEVGCQGEVGVACSMAAAGLTELMGGSPEQVCQAAEIAMEHNLGLTCDPVAGQVQVPCIERNAIAAVKAINASRMALRRTSKACVSLDKVIATMYATGKDMDAKYRETSQGGLAIKVSFCD